MDKDNNIKNVSSSLYDISSKIKLLRISKGLSQERLGELVGVTKATVSNYEKDACFPSIEVLYQLAIVLDVSADELLGLSNNNFEEIDYNKLIGEIVNISKLSKKDQKRIIVYRPQKVRPKNLTERGRYFNGKIQLRVQEKDSR